MVCISSLSLLGPVHSVVFGGYDLYSVARMTCINRIKYIYSNQLSFAGFLRVTGSYSLNARNIVAVFLWFCGISSELSVNQIFMCSLCSFGGYELNYITKLFMLVLY